MKALNQIGVTIPSEYKEFIDAKELCAVVDNVLKNLNITKSEISISFVGEDRIREINHQYRGKNAVTDVLSFSINEINPENGLQMLGDILISVPTAKEQAEMIGDSLKKEIDLLVIHGILHLCGYDHENKDDEKKMFSIQQHLLKMAS
jgi:probable rRNA maturation factor